MNRIVDPVLDRQTRFEAERVGMVVEAFRLRAYLPDLYAATEARTGVRALTFAGFQAVFPTFPLRLAAVYIHGTSHITPAAFYRRLTGGYWLDKYLERWEEPPAGPAARTTVWPNPRPFGLILPLDGYPGGFVLHDAATPGGGAWWTADIAGGPPHRVIFEPFKGFLASLAGCGWTPEPTNKTGALVHPHPPRGSRVPDALDTFNDPPLAVYLWLVRVLRSAAPGDRRRVWRVDAHTRGVVVTDEDLADDTRLTPRTVRRALGQLRDRGLLERPRMTDGRRAIVVSADGWDVANALAATVRPDLAGG